MSESRLAADLFSAHKRALGAADRPLSSMSPRVRRQYERFAEELRPVLNQDRDAPLKRLCAERDEARADRAYIAAAIDRWQDGIAAPHDVLTAIRDRLTGGPR